MWLWGVWTWKWAVRAAYSVRGLTNEEDDAAVPLPLVDGVNVGDAGRKAQPEVGDQGWSQGDQGAGPLQPPEVWA